MERDGVQPQPTIAVLSRKNALASLLGATLRRGQEWRVRVFDEIGALDAYMRLAPVAVLVADYQLGEQTAADVAGEIRGNGRCVSRDARIIALARTIGPDMRARCVASGIDEVIAKPMSPLYLEERVRALLHSGSQSYVSALPGYLGPERRGRIVMADLRATEVERRSGNVVSFLAHKAMREGLESVGVQREIF